MNSDKESVQKQPRLPWQKPRVKKIDPSKLKPEDPRLAAMKQLREKARPLRLFPLLALLSFTACAPQPSRVSAEQIRDVYIACNARRGVATNHRTDVERCAHPKLVSLYADAPDFGLMEVYWTTKLEIAERLDAGKITQGEADAELAWATSLGMSQLRHREAEWMALAQ